MKKTLAGAAIFLVAAYVFALPYITVHQIRQAVKARDSVALSEHIDFPSVRLSLKDQLNAALMGKIQSDEMKDNPFAALGMMLAGPLVDKMLEAYVTPAGIGQLLSGKKTQHEGCEKNTARNGRRSKQCAADWRISYGRKTLGRCDARLQNR